MGRAGRRSTVSAIAAGLTGILQGYIGGRQRAAALEAEKEEKLEQRRFLAEQSQLDREARAATAREGWDIEEDWRNRAQSAATMRTVIGEIGSTTRDLLKSWRDRADEDAAWRRRLYEMTRREAMEGAKLTFEGMIKEFERAVANRDAALSARRWGINEAGRRAQALAPLGEQDIEDMDPGTLAALRATPTDLIQQSGMSGDIPALPPAPQFQMPNFPEPPDMRPSGFMPRGLFGSLFPGMQTQQPMAGQQAQPAQQADPLAVIEQAMSGFVDPAQLDAAVQALSPGDYSSMERWAYRKVRGKEQLTPQELVLIQAIANAKGR